MFISEDTMLAVKKGATWLDNYHPGWAKKINIDELDMNNCNQCIIGQAVCNYFDLYTKDTHAGWDYQAIEDWAIDYGFQAPDGTDESQYQKFSNLETVWSDEVRKRLG